jgi:hypothetical protein
MRSLFRSFVLPSLLLVVPAIGGAQQPAPTAAAPVAPSLPIPAVGDMAPDFAIRGATRYGLLRDAARLSDYRGQTVVIWLFFKARTRG